MIAWYCNVPHTEKRLSFEEFGKGKAAGEFKFGSVPVINMKDGTQQAQTQSIIRWVALKFKGRKGEKLYPGKADPEASYRIDTLTEKSDAFLGKFSFYFKAPVSEETAKENGVPVMEDIVKCIE